MAHMFTNSNNIVISGSPTFNAIQNLSTDKIDEGLKILYAHAAPGALHNSGERFDPPNCHPGTRTKVLEEIINWVNNLQSERPVMWMKGPMGAGKSSIAQVLAELFQKRGQLSGSFFFARANPIRNNKNRLVATLAYQMTKEIPQMRPYISASILHDPLIFESSLEQQISALIIDPHFCCANLDPDKSSHNKLRLLIIDGLDECENKEAQAFIVKAFVSSIAVHQDKPPISLKILIASRPEVNIDAAFQDQKLTHFVNILSLNEQWLPDQDIKKFLMDSFENIRGTHPIGKSLLSHWPLIKDIDELVRRSSGQFIYASVIIKFLQSPQNHPIESLKVILGLSKNADSQPYAELDALYAHIFSKVQNLPLVLRILSLRLVPRINNEIKAPEIKDILQLPKGMLTVALTDLVSVLDYNHREIRFHHASLSEFLQDQDRSGELFVNGEDICMDLAGRCVPFNKNVGIQWSLITRRDVFINSYENLSAEARSSLCDSLSDMDFLPILKVRQHNILKNPSKYCHWLFAQHAKNSKAELPNSLENAVKSCLVYILEQFKAFPFSGFDQTDGADIWIFAMCRIIDAFDKVTIHALSILTDLDISEIQNFQKLQSMQVCLEILHSIPPEILRSSELFGEYAITDDRCINAALRIFKAITQMKASEEGDSLRKFFMYDHWGIVSKLLHQTPASQNVYKIFKEAMLPHTWRSFSEGDPLKELAYKYVLATFGSDFLHVFQYSKELASVLSGYMKKTQQVIPNIDSIIEPMLQAELQLITISSKVSKIKKLRRSRILTDVNFQSSALLMDA